MQWGKPRHCEAGCRSSPGMPKLNRQVDCFVANAPRNDGGGALLAITWESAGVEVCKKTGGKLWVAVSTVMNMKKKCRLRK